MADELEACATCGVVPEPCSFCPTEARHFLDANVHISGVPDSFSRVDATVYFCDKHVEMLSDEAKEAGFQDGKDRDIELAMYTPNNDCSKCDSWG